MDKQTWETIRMISAIVAIISLILIFVGYVVDKTYVMMGVSAGLMLTFATLYGVSDDKVKSPSNS